VIVGLGIDVEQVARIDDMLARWGERFARRVFTDGERAYCAGRGRPGQHYAARFAAKEAALKALGVPPGLSWHEMEIVSGAGGAPALRLTGQAAMAAARLGVVRALVSLTHTDDVAAAVVVLEAGDTSRA
jgi:holo-[acyl-carrier protein] synthase